MKEKWEEERLEKDKEIFDVRHLLDEQMKEKVDKVKALLEKQAQAAEKLKVSHQQEIKDLMEKHQQEVRFINCCGICNRVRLIVNFSSKQ